MSEVRRSRWIPVSGSACGDRYEPRLAYVPEGQLIAGFDEPRLQRVCGVGASLGPGCHRDKGEGMPHHTPTGDRSRARGAPGVSQPGCCLVLWV